MIRWFLLGMTFFVLASCGKPVPLAEMQIPFTGESVMGDIEDDAYRFFRYATMEAAKNDVAKVAPDGKSIAGTVMRWPGPVHIYYLRKRIVVYVGENPHTLAAIQQVFGPQFAGDPMPEQAPQPAVKL